MKITIKIKNIRYGQEVAVSVWSEGNLYVLADDKTSHIIIL